AFERRAAGASYGEIARWLNSQGFEPRGSNEIFTPFAMKDKLRSPFYTGIVNTRSDVMPGQHEAIVTDELFERFWRSGTRRRPGGLPRGRLACCKGDFTAAAAAGRCTRSATVVTSHAIGSATAPRARRTA